MTAELARARAATGGYVHANAAFDDELGRLRLLQARYDPRTFARLSMFGPLAGTRCLEVGAGAGSVARWLAAQVGPSGQVVATDTNPRFLAAAHSTGVEVRRHDILTDPLEPGRYDLVHCRPCCSTCPTLCKRSAPWRRRSGRAAGCSSKTPTTSRLPLPTRITRERPASTRPRQTTAVLRSVGDLRPLPRPAPALARHRRRLAETGSEAIACHRQGGSGEAELLRRSLERMSPMALSHGAAAQEELDAVSAATADPSFSFLDALSVAAWGRVPCSGTAQ